MKASSFSLQQDNRRTRTGTRSTSRVAPTHHQDVNSRNTGNLTDVMRPPCSTRPPSSGISISISRSPRRAAGREFDVDGREVWAARPAPQWCRPTSPVHALRVSRPAAKRIGVNIDFAYAHSPWRRLVKKPSPGGCRARCTCSPCSPDSRWGRPGTTRCCRYSAKSSSRCPTQNRQQSPAACTADSVHR